MNFYTSTRLLTDILTHTHTTWVTIPVDSGATETTTILWLCKNPQSMGGSRSRLLAATRCHTEGREGSLRHTLLQTPLRASLRVFDPRHSMGDGWGPDAHWESLSADLMLISCWIWEPRGQPTKVPAPCGHQAMQPPSLAGSRAPCSPELTSFPNFRSVGLKSINHAVVPAKETAYPDCSRQVPEGGKLLEK